MPSSAALLRASPQLRADQQAGGRVAGSYFAVGGLCRRSLQQFLLAWARLCTVGCRRNDSPGLLSPSVQQPGCSVLCVWPEAVCAQDVCVPCSAYKSPGVPQGAWDRL